MPEPAPEPDIPLLVDRLLDRAVAAGASDLHVDPEPDRFRVSQRIDGLLRESDPLAPETGRAVVARLMVMAKLLTYRRDIPQEGRLTALCPAANATVEMRLAVMPTTHGLRAVVRLPADLAQPRSLADLGLPQHVLHLLHRFADADAGLLLLTGPAGSGKTTTIYALLSHIAARHPGLSIVTLEDPVERRLPGITQIAINPQGELTFERALRSVLRQDPQVLVLGEIRDASTASIAVQAALSGHRLIATLHAGRCSTAIARLLEMGIEPYQITSALYGVVAQRLVRRRDPESPGSYRGRAPIASAASMDDALNAAVLARADAPALDRVIAAQPNHQSLRQSADDAVAAGVTDADECRRVLG